MIPSQLESLLLRAYDPSRLFSLVDGIVKKNTLHSSISYEGEGTRSRVYLWRKNELSLIIKIGHEVFDEGFETHFDQEWADRIYKMQSAQITMLPPLVLMPYEGSFVTVTIPLKEKPGVQIDWNKVEEKKQKFELDMSSVNLRLNDILQIGFYEAIPFVRDLSDLVELTKDSNIGSNRKNSRHRRLSFRT